MAHILDNKSSMCKILVKQEIIDAKYAKLGENITKYRFIRKKVN